MSVEFNHARRQTTSNPIVSFDEEADLLVGAAPYEQTDERTTYRTNNAINRLNREIGRRTRAVDTFPDGKPDLMLVVARLKYVADSK